MRLINVMKIIGDYIKMKKLFNQPISASFLRANRYDTYMCCSI